MLKYIFLCVELLKQTVRDPKPTIPFEVALSAYNLFNKFNKSKLFRTYWLLQ